MLKFKQMLEKGEDCVLDATNTQDFESIANICGALSSISRLKILHALQIPPFQKSLPELSKQLGIPMTTLVYNIEVMEKAGLIKIKYRNQTNNNVRLVFRNFKTLSVQLYNYQQLRSQLTTSTQEQHIGSFVDYTGENLSFATKDTHYQHLGRQIYHPMRNQAELIYTANGCLKYYFDNTVEKLQQIADVAFELEMCSEAPYYDLNYRSDITFWVNGVELCTYTLPSDFGGRQGRQTPDWWGMFNTQYGMPITLRIDGKGVEINGKRMSNVTIAQLHLSQDNKIDFTFGNKSTATSKGGFNLFGAHFGDYPHHIVLHTTYKE